MQGVMVALARGVGQIPLSKFAHLSGPEQTRPSECGRVWQMGLPCTVSGTWAGSTLFRQWAN